MYSIKLNEKQLRVMETALELVGRLGIGQLNMVAEVLWQMYPEEKYYPASDFYRLMESMKSLMHMNGQGITHDDTSDIAQIAWDMYQVVRKGRYDNMDKENKQLLSYSTIANEPMNWGPEPLIEVEYNV